jgi:uncharacterized DUF497 family protein
MPTFEYDASKSRTNKVKHGIDFIEAQQLWNDTDLIEIPARSLDEPRTLVIGRIAVRLWSAIVTQRGENIRIISVRPARREESDIYES